MRKNSVKNVLIVGDVHGNFGKLNQLVNRHRPNMVLCAGDFGFFPKWHGQSYLDNAGRVKIQDQYSTFTGMTPVYWCDGNHEDFGAIKDLNVEKSPYFMMDFYERTGSHIYYMKRGSVLTLEDGRNILFIGGAFSIDRAWRELGKSYWLEEVLTENDIKDLPDMEIFAVISHTAPTDFKFHLPLGKEIVDPSRDILQKVFDKYRPRKWFFGHFHKYSAGIYKGCNWQGLAHSDSMSDKWWTWLK